MDRKRLRDILCACAVMLMLTCGSYVIRGMAGPYAVAGYGRPAVDSLAAPDSVTVPDSPVSPDSLVLTDSLMSPDSLFPGDSLSVPDSLAVPDSLSDSTAADSIVVYTVRQLRQMERDSIRKRKDAYKDSVSAIKQAALDSVHYIRDSIRAFKDSVRWAKPRVLDTWFLPDSLYYQRVLSWTTGTYANEYRHADVDTTFNDWYTEYPFYKEDIDAVYLGTVGSATQNVNFFRRREFDIFKGYAPYLTYSHTPEDLQFYNVKSPYTELAYWGTIFAFKDKEETNVRFMHTQNITPEWNIAVLFQGWKAAGILTREETSNNSLEVTTNYLGRDYVMNAGFIHHNITRQENGGIQDSYMVRDTTVDAKTIAVNLQNAQNKLSRNTFFLNHSYNIHLESRSQRVRKAMEKDSAMAAAVDSLVGLRMAAYERAVDAAVEAAKRPPVPDSTAVPSDSLGFAADSLLSPVPDSLAAAPDSLQAVSDTLADIQADVQDTLAAVSEDTAAVQLTVDPLSVPVDTASAQSPVDSLPAPAADSAASAAVADTASVLAPEDSIAMAVADSLLRASVMDTLLPPTREEIYAQLCDSLLFGQGGEGPLISVGHVGEVSRYYRYYTDEIGLTDEVGRNFYNNMFYLNPTSSADSMRVLSVDNKLFFKLQPWARDAVVSEITGGVGYQWNSIYAFRPEMFITGNRNVHQSDLYIYAGAAGEYKKYLRWGADARYSFLGYYRNDFDVDAFVDISFYPFKDKAEPITLGGRFSTSLKEPDWYSQHYWSNHYVWDNDFGKTSTTKVEAQLDIPKWRMDAGFSYALINNYLYNDTLGIVRQHTGLVNVMSAYLHKDFKLWWFHLDNHVLFQYSSDRNVLPLPMFTFHLRYYIEIEAVKNVLTLQLGADARLNTLYYAPAYNPALGTFQLQTRELIGNNPYIDVFLNMQWKRVNVFLKVVNVGEGWPDGGAMFSAYHYIRPTLGFKVGIHWPFYIE